MLLSNLRQDYTKGNLIEKDLKTSPFEQFELWFNHVLEEKIPDPNAMVLSTVNNKEEPSSRIMLLKDFDCKGFVFYTNYDSRKGHDLEYNSNACLLFFWQSLERQIRINGVIKKIKDRDSDLYYESRPLESRIGAWASLQSKVMRDKEDLNKRINLYTEKFGNNPTRPKNWGGYILEPKLFEFWQGGSSRLHDRITYTKDSDKKWKIERLYP
ncbi:pyridoxamine 5'-phosphate oxidase [Candidatus Kinetoplastibacterium blastocrithidii TCC012E]|uniref:Pyridoxine/pyridoxamine 5'-phosphate oxidase n=1 Tax=Candidatus Kinetoplastidibacterium blastocrithidiae TCC012E TaxID=1208922 RepID=M1M116_9PROT|nr:pyridoxamine 5'-phosphate oxidase [Candidatus Kinetoplastibacterium blastocrithidii]AFZ83857.1 pyridoxamine 5'-phosphate oxidase [Candidatus Kinetoplastibacterium blastocrithidii (ex Strigomonas culicis)]AGF49976.1 pyridoxamine 5'-phosphate oxidase [Candidatus Kinetoplastibacterium blastocrithidii TCC012E]